MNETRCKEIELLSAAQRGDNKAFDRLVMNNQKAIFRAVMRDCVDPDLAADVMQDALIRAYKSLPAFRGEASFSTWFFRIARNVCWRRKQQIKSQDTVSLDQPIFTNSDADSMVRQVVDYYAENPQETLLENEVKQRISAAVESLPSSLRAVLVLRDMEDQSTQETADKLGITTMAVKARLHRARAALRLKLQDYFSEDAN